MGLDIAFNRKAADAAGIETGYIPNSDFDYIADRAEDVARYNYLKPDFKHDQLQEHLEWSRKVDLCIRVPGTGLWIADNGVDGYVVRASNPDVYFPLTDWLIDNDIKWSEF